MENNEQNISSKEIHDQKKQQKISERESAARKKKAKSLLIWSSVLVLVALSLWGLVALINKTPGTANSDLPDSVTSADWIKGSASSSVVLVEYGDYQCPACAAYNSFTNKLAAEFGDNITFVYRNFPLRQIHPNADASAQAAEAAGAQGKYWEMHDLLFSKQKDWEKSTDAKKIFESYATSLGLNLEKFKADFESDAVKEKIDRDLAGAEKANLPGTPSFFLNGKSIANPQSYEEFRNLIRGAGAAPVAN